MEKTIKPRSESRNFFVSLASLFLLTLTLTSGQEISIAAGELIDRLTSGNIITITTLLFVNFLNPMMKIIGKYKRGELKTDFLWSANFLTQSLTVVLSGIAIVGIVFQPDAAAEIIAAVNTRDFNEIWIALGINIFNPIYHFIRKNKNQPDIEN